MRRLLLCCCLLFPLIASAQLGEKLANFDLSKLGRVSGNVQLDAQYYIDDTIIGTQEVPEDFLYNAYAQVNYTAGNFAAGLRYEAYQNPLLGFSQQYSGQGIANRFVSYRTDDFEVTAGHFYEQFGSGMTLRAYWEPLLGTDNAIDGFMAKGRILDAITVKGLIGKQRLYWDVAPGIVRGGDLEVNLPSLIDSALASKLTFNIGGSFVSRYLEDDNPELVLPENVAMYGGRFNLGYGKFSLFGEYAQKVNDPAEYNLLFDEFYHYNRGSGMLLSATYAQRGLGVTVSAKRLENMDFRSARNADFAFNEVPINFLPPLAQQHTYRLQTLYLYATAPNGELGLQADVVYNIPRGSALGGKYGMDIAVNFSNIFSLKRDTSGLAEDLEYASSELFTPGDEVYYRDLNINVTKKLSRKFKMSLMYIWAKVNLELSRIGTGTPTVHTAIFDGYIRMKKRRSLHLQAQHLYAEEDEGPDGNEGSWAMLMAEYTIAPHWFFAVWDEWNYGNADPDRRLHYFGGQVGYNFEGTRIAAGYARQREGIICVGGVCRILPAANGATLSISTTF